MPASGAGAGPGAGGRVAGARRGARSHAASLCCADTGARCCRAHAARRRGAAVDRRRGLRRGLSAREPKPERFAAWWLPTLRAASASSWPPISRASIWFSRWSASRPTASSCTTARRGRRRPASSTLALARGGRGLPADRLRAAGGRHSGQQPADPLTPWRRYPHRRGVIRRWSLLIIGFGLKIGLVPLHVWMPLAYRRHPCRLRPCSAVPRSRPA